MKIIVLAGGLSPERDVSLSSGSLIANSLIKSGNDVLLIDVYEGMSIKEHQNLDDLFYTKENGKTYSYIVPTIEPDLELIKKNNNGQNALIGENVLILCQYADIVFVALHGSMGENGQLQATFDNFGIKYTGTGYIGSLLAMDKDITKKLLVQAEIKTAEWILLNIKNDNINSINEKIGFPCVVKPCSCGSSIGVSIVYDESQLKQAINSAEKYEDFVLIEKMIKGREFSIGILDGEALPVIEIITKEGFYDYKNKYQSGMTSEVCPAQLSIELTAEVQKLSLKVHEILRLRDYSRIDFILNENNDFVCLEANALPGMTPTSLIPQEVAVLGIGYDELCKKIAYLALKR